MKKVVIIGAANYADIVKFYVEKELHTEVSAYAVNKEFFVPNEKRNGIPITVLEDIEKDFPSKDYDICLGLIGNNMYEDRERIYNDLKNKGYNFPNIICKSASIDSVIDGDANIIFPGVVIGPYCKIGCGNIIWQNVVIAHQNTVGNFNNFSAGSIMAGLSKVEDHCFLGNNCEINNFKTVRRGTLVGAGAFVAKDTEEYSVIVPARSIVLEGKKSTDFM